MKTKTKTKLLAVLLASASIANAAVTISGTALLNSVGLSNTDLAVFIVSLDGSSIEGSDFGLTAGDDLTSSASYGANFQIIATTNAADFFGSTSVATTTNVTFAGSLGQDDPFAILTFSGNSTTAAVGSFNVWSDASWDMPIDGITENFGTELVQIGAVGPGSLGTVVPEPSSYAALAGLLALGCVALRRRK